MKTLIVEDDLILAKRMIAQLNDLAYHECQTVNSGEKAIALIKTQEIDIVFMDIELEDTLSGIETTEIINTFREDLPIIYFSKLGDSKTLSLIKQTKHVYFLPKPFNLVQLKTILDYVQMQEKTEYEIPVLDGNLFVKKKDQYNRLAFEDILWIEGGRNSVTIYAVPSQKYVLSGTFGPLCEKIDHSYLVRVHKSYLVNLQHIDAVRGRQFVINNQTIPFSKTFVPDLEKLLLVIKSSK